VECRMLSSLPRLVYRARSRKRRVNAGFRAVRLMNVPRGSEVSPRGQLARETGGRRDSDM
jgi:hypothetical protein